MDSSVTLEAIREFAFLLRTDRLLNQVEGSELGILYLTNQEWDSVRRTWSRDIPGPELGQVLFGLTVIVNEEKAAERKATLGW